MDQIQALAHRITAHDSARACLIVLAMIAACALAELICKLTGVPA